MLNLHTAVFLSLTLLTGPSLSACQPSSDNTPPPTTDNPQPQAPIVIHKARLSPDSNQVLVHLLQSKGEPIKPGEAPNLQQAVQVCQTADGSCKLVQSWTTFPSSLTSDLWWSPDGQSFLWQQDTNHTESKTSAPTILNRTTIADLKTQAALKGENILLGVQGITDNYLYANLGAKIFQISRNTGKTTAQHQVPMDFYLDLIYQASPNDGYLQMTLPKAPDKKGTQPNFQIKQGTAVEEEAPPPPPTDSYFFDLKSKQTILIEDLKDTFFLPAESGFSPQGQSWASRSGNEVRLHDLKTGKTISSHVLPVKGVITGLFWRNEQELLLATPTAVYHLSIGDGTISELTKMPEVEGSFIYMQSPDNLYLANKGGLFRLDLAAPTKGWQSQLNSPDIGLIFTDLNKRALAVESKEDGSLPGFYLVKGAEQFKLTLKLLPLM